MKLMISEEKYKKGINKLVYRLPVELLVIGFVIILVVQLIMKALSGGITTDVMAEVSASSFFYAAMTTAIVYFIKGRRFAGAFETDPKATVEGDIDYYLPCIEGSSIKGAKAGFLLIQGNKMIFVHKKVDGFVVENQFEDLSKIKITAGMDAFNPYSFLVFGFRDVLYLEDDKNKLKFNMFEAAGVVEELRQTLRRTTS